MARQMRVSLFTDSSIPNERITLMREKGCKIVPTQHPDDLIQIILPRGVQQGEYWEHTITRNGLPYEEETRRVYNVATAQGGNITWVEVTKDYYTLKGEKFSTNRTVEISINTGS